MGLEGIFAAVCSWFLWLWRSLRSLRGLQQLSDLQQKLELDLQEDNLTELPAVKHRKLTNTDLMELEAQRKDEKKQEEEEGTEEPKRFTTQEIDKRMFFILGDTGSF